MPCPRVQAVMSEPRFELSSLNSNPYTHCSISLLPLTELCVYLHLEKNCSNFAQNETFVLRWHVVVNVFASTFSDQCLLSSVMAEGRI